MRTNDELDEGGRERESRKNDCAKKRVSSMQGRRTASQPAATSSLNTIKHHSFIQTDGRMNGRTDGRTDSTWSTDYTLPPALPLSPLSLLPNNAAMLSWRRNRQDCDQPSPLFLPLTTIESCETQQNRSAQLESEWPTAFTPLSTMLPIMRGERGSEAVCRLFRAPNPPQFPPSVQNRSRRHRLTLLEGRSY